MAGGKLDSIGDYERFIEATIKAWTPEQRVALAAAMAERWLPVYEAFSTREEWGDPAHLRRSLEAVWNHLQGRSLSTSDVTRYMVQVEDITPHIDDFGDDALAALAACTMFSEALRSCVTADTIAPTMQAVISGFEAFSPDWEMDPEEQPRPWRQIRVQREFKKQQKLIEEINAITHFDKAAIQALREKLTSRAFIAEAMPVAETAAGPTTITNQTAFEIYRRMVESDLEHNTSDWWEDEENEPESFLWAIRLFAEWSARYGRRRATIKPGFASSQLADVSAQQALVARQRALDSADAAIPDWGSELHQMIGIALQNAHNEFDVTAFDQPHSYGPSLRRLWIEGQRHHPPQEIWRHIVAWARHRPAAWEAEDRRKRQGLAHTSPELGGLLARELSWDRTGDVEYPWAAEVDGERWQIRLNDFPDDYAYSLVIDGNNAGDFHDWPETWQRD